MSTKLIERLEYSRGIIVADPRNTLTGRLDPVEPIFNTQQLNTSQPREALPSQPAPAIDIGRFAANAARVTAVVATIAAGGLAAESLINAPKVQDVCRGATTEQVDQTLHGEQRISLDGQVTIDTRGVDSVDIGEYKGAMYMPLTIGEVRTITRTDFTGKRYFPPTTEIALRGTNGAEYHAMNNGSNEIIVRGICPVKK